MRRRSDDLSVDELVPDAAVEHTSVEVDTLVPASQVVLHVLIDKGLLSGVVLFHNFPPDVLFEEGVGCGSNLFEVLVRVVTVNH